MNNKLTVNKLVTLLSERSGWGAKDCDNIIRGLFRQISEALERGENVKVKGLGTFKLLPVESRKSVDVTSGKENEIPAHTKIVFVPDKELASKVNEPFEMFETIELNESILEEDLMEAEAEGNFLLANEYEGEMILNNEKKEELFEKYPAVKTILEDKDALEEESDSEVDEDNQETVNLQSEEDKSQANEDMSAGAPEDTGTIDSADPADNEEVPPVMEETKRNRGFGRGFFSGIASAVFLILLGLIALWFLNEDFNDFGRKALKIKGIESSLKSSNKLDGESGHAAESLVNEEGGLTMGENEMEEMEGGVPSIVDDAEADDLVPTKPSDRKERYDTVTTTHYLTTMAKKFYGNYHLWPYIYKENSKILGHPNRIRPGTRVVIPDLSKYGVNPENPADIEKAKKLGSEIYKRYQ